jgi:hypothetical protein
MGIREFTPHPTTKKQPNLEYPESSRKIRKEKKQQKRTENREGDERICWMASSQNVLEFKKIKNR